jgi:vacuolar-type H+-ATPase subunit F/Vma7
MNSLIRDYAFESGFASVGFAQGKPLMQYENELTRFARLIIEDCIGIALISDGNGEQIAEEIRQYFTRSTKE